MDSSRDFEACRLEEARRLQDADSEVLKKTQVAESLPLTPETTCLLSVPITTKHPLVLLLLFTGKLRPLAVRPYVAMRSSNCEAVCNYMKTGPEFCARTNFTCSRIQLP